MRRLPETAPSRQSWKKLRQRRGKLDIRENRTKVAAMPEAAPIRSRLRAICPFSRAFSRRRGVACSVWLASAIGQLTVASRQLPVASCQRTADRSTSFHEWLWGRARLEPCRSELQTLRASAPEGAGCPFGNRLQNQCASFKILSEASRADR